MLDQRIDLHGHYFPPAYNEALQKNHIELLDGVKAPEWSMDKQLEYMKRLNISFATLSISSPYPYFKNNSQAEVNDIIRRSNEYGGSLQQQYSDKIKILASLPLSDINVSLDEIRYCRENLNILGFALLTNYNGMYLGDERLDPIMEELNKKATLVTIHPTVPISPIKGACVDLPAPVMEYFFETTRAVTNMLLRGIIHRYPNIKFVIPHGGAFLTILSDRMIPLTNILFKDRELDIAKDLANMYYDLAGFSMPKQFDLLRKITDDSHIVYGSDSPFTFLPVCEDQAKNMDERLNSQLKKLIYKENSYSLLKETGMN